MQPLNNINVDLRVWQKLLNWEGYSQIFLRTEEARFESSPHTHPIDVTKIILSGNLTVSLEGERYMLRPGDRLTIEKYLEHSVVVGPEGCSLILAVWM